MIYTDFVWFPMMSYDLHMISLDFQWINKIAYEFVFSYKTIKIVIWFLMISCVFQMNLQSFVMISYDFIQFHTMSYDLLWSCFDLIKFHRYYCDVLRIHMFSYDYIMMSYDL